MLRILSLFFLLLALSVPALADDFTLQQKTSASGPTLLIVGGIHGDEPGGFNAAALLISRYTFLSGNLWIIPDLNRTSILHRVHGRHGDMNYKFNGLSTADPDFKIVQQVKQLIIDPQVELIFNLHDGSGYYSPEYRNSQQNPNRWGQTCVIDQAQLEGVRFGNLAEISQKAVSRINQKLLQPAHRFQVKNTHTAISNKVMQTTLTYYAVRQHKPAIGLEASKKLPTHLRVYYLLNALEAYFAELDITFSRDFDLTPEAVKRALTTEVRVAFADGQITLPLTNLRPLLKHFPLEKDRSLNFRSDNPLVEVRPNGEQYRLHFGNNRLAFLQPDYREYDRSLNSCEILVAGKSSVVRFGEQLRIQDSFQLKVPEGYRVNVIGYRQPNLENEAGQDIRLEQLDRNYSIDNDGRIFRGEIYRGDKFCGMLLLEFV
jgi:hypothetical protein